jgi:transcriptional regulator with XRE-family HTH domain
MENEILAQISQKIKSIRKDKNLTLQEIAERAGVTKGLISQIENSRTIPSLLVLMQLIKALEVDLNFFFNDLSLDGKIPPILVLRKEQYERFEKENNSGYLYDRIFTRKFKSGAVDFVLLEIQPGAQRDFVTTDAFEYKYMLQGSVAYHFRNETIWLHEGDSMLFDGRLEHNPVNTATTPAKMLVVYFFENAE